LPEPVHALYPGILLQLPRAAACAGRLPVDVYLQEELWLPLTLRFCSYPGQIASRCLAANQVKMQSIRVVILVNLTTGGTELLYYLVMFVICFCFEDTLAYNHAIGHNIQSFWNKHDYTNENEDHDKTGLINQMSNEEKYINNKNNQNPNLHEETVLQNSLNDYTARAQLSNNNNNNFITTNKHDYEIEIEDQLSEINIEKGEARIDGDYE
jgi:hypothetical protein